MKIALAGLIAATCAALAEAKAQPFDRSEVCAVLTAADQTVIGDHLQENLEFGNARPRHNFEAEKYDCEGRSYPTQIGAVRPAYLSIGFSEDNDTAIVGIETVPAFQSGIGQGYDCVFRRTAADHWDVLGCRPVLVLHHQSPPDQIPAR